EAIRSNVILGRGVYKSVNAGRTWEFVGLKDVGQIGQLKIHPKNPDIAYVAAVGNPFAWGPERGVYRTKDGGKTWQKVLFINEQIEAKGPKGGLYRTNDGGASWTAVNSTQALRARPFYFNKVFANPKDENDVWVTELALHHSTDGGKTFGTVAEPHGDNHIVWINPENPKIIIETNDGGANVTQDGGRSWSSQNNQPTAEMY